MIGPTSEAIDAFRALPLMSSDFSVRLDRHFASLTDPRRGKVTYPLINIVAIA